MEPLNVEIRSLIIKINGLIKGQDSAQDDEFWEEAGLKILAFIDSIVTSHTSVNAWTPKEYSEDNICLFNCLFNILANIRHPKRPFRSGAISFYELALSRACALISQILGDRFPYIQKTLIKHIFGPSNVCSFMASDIYIFIFRIAHPNRKIAICQIIMNLCRIAPPEALVKGAALINRFKHPIVNFENPKYQDIIEF